MRAVPPARIPRPSSSNPRWFVSGYGFTHFASAPGYRFVPFNRSHPRMASSWHRIGPEALYWAPRHVAALWNAKENYSTENGCVRAVVAFCSKIERDTKRTTTCPLRPTGDDGEERRRINASAAEHGHALRIADRPKNGLLAV